MTFVQKLLLLFSLLAILSSCEEVPQDPTYLTQEALIPIPAKVTETNKVFPIKGRMDLFADRENEEIKKITEHIANQWEALTTYKLNFMKVGSMSIRGISLELSDQHQGEAYMLNIDTDLIRIVAGTSEGLFRGWQTLEQLVRLQKADEKGRLFLPTGEIEDAPNYGYRGTMLDVSRHFFSVEEVKTYIDMIAMYKINYLHLHLSDDQGWRIEIKSWPNLTTHGGSTEVDGGEGGFYTQEDYQELIRYAQARYITIVPEIDMPGHTNAALASYAELNCDGKARELYTGTEVGFSTLCAEKEITYQFVDDVVREIASITPGPYFHIGGDESHVTSKEDYITFVTKALKIVEKYNKTPIGWDEINQADLPANTVAQYWHNAENTAAAVGKGAKVLMSPAAYAYLDMKYDSTTRLGLSWAALIDVKRGYDWNPDSLEASISKEDILGIEAPLWAETIENLSDITHLAFPRLCGYAEIGWSAASQRNWDAYRRRLARHGSLMDQMEIDFYPSPLIDWE